MPRFPPHRWLLGWLLIAAALAVLPALTRPALAEAAPAAACGVLDGLAQGSGDAAPALQRCLDASAAGVTVALAPGRYLLARAITMTRPVTVTTRGMGADAPACRQIDARCAVLLVRPAPGTVPSGSMPVTVRGHGVTIDHLVLRGSGAAVCRDPALRPSAGGLRVTGDGFRAIGSVFTGFACYTSLEYTQGQGGVISRNLFAGNGTHTARDMWSDGLTIHEAAGLKVTGNRFVDNTDVQLILGGCRDCQISGNSFRHSGDAAGGSFAEMMIQAWPGHTSGRYEGSQFVRNDIDCGVARRCGFGILIGSSPWYDAPVSGGLIARNRVANAMLDLDVDGLAGPVTLAANDLSGGPGSFPASCGQVALTATINVAPADGDKVRGLAAGASRSARSLRGCILNWAVPR